MFKASSIVSVVVVSVVFVVVVVVDLFLLLVEKDEKLNCSDFWEISFNFFDNFKSVEF